MNKWNKFWNWIWDVGAPDSPEQGKCDMDVTPSKVRFDVQYFPVSGRYYPRDNGSYLKRSWKEGTIVKEDYEPVANWFTSEEKAIAFLDEYIESDTRVGTEIRPYK